MPVDQMHAYQPPATSREVTLQMPAPSLAMDAVDACGAVERYGMIARFSVGTQLLPDCPESDANPCLIAEATHFSQEEGAARFISDTMARLLDDPAPYDQVTPLPVDDLPSYGDATAGFSYVYSMLDLGSSHGVAILFRQGRVVYELELEGAVAPDMTMIDAVVQDLLDCTQDAIEQSVNRPSSPNIPIDQRSLPGANRG